MQTSTTDATAATPEFLADASHRFEIPGATNVLDVTFGPHDGSVYVAVNAEAIAPRAVAFSVWPEVGGIIAVVILLVLGVIMLRIARRPRKRGEMYCAKCNYCVTNAEFERCPECGCDLTSKATRAGRLMPVRMAVPAALAIVVLVIGVVLAIWGPSRRAAWMTTAGPHWSVDLASKARSEEITRLTPFIQKGTLIVRVDPATGATEPFSFVPRTFAVGLSFEMRFNGDGSAIVVRTTSGGLVAIDGVSGRLIAELEDSEYISDPRREWPSIAGYSADGDVAYVVRLAHSDGETRLVAWDFRRNEARVLHASPTESYEAAHGEMRFASRYVSYMTDDGVRFLRYPSDYGVNRNNLDREHSTIELVNEAGDVIATQKAPMETAETPQIAADGRTVVQGSLGRGQSILLAFEELKTVQSKRVPILDGRNLRLVGGDRFLMTSRHDGEILVRSAETLEQIGSFKAPGDLIFRELATDQTGRYVAAIGFQRKAPTPNPTVKEEVLLFDLDDQSWFSGEPANE